MPQAPLRGRPHESLGALLARAADLVLRESGATGIIRVEAVEPGESPRTKMLSVAIDTTVKLDGGEATPQTVEARIRKRGRGAGVGRGVIEQALRLFGGNRYTSLCLRGPAPRLSFDATVVFPFPQLPVAKNEVSAVEPLVQTTATALDAALDALGIRRAVRSDGGRFDVPAWELRRPPSTAQQADAYLRARDAAPGVALHTAALPITRSMRLEEGRTAGEAGTLIPYLDVFMSQGLSERGRRYAVDLGRLQAFIETTLRIELGALSWRVLGGPPGHSEGGKIPLSLPGILAAAR